MSRRVTATSVQVETPMKRWLVTMCAALLLAGVVSPARAVGPIFDWDPAYFYGDPSMTPSNQPSGTILKAVGILSAFGAPLEFLNATMPATEYTFYIDGLVSQGTTTVGPPATEIYTTFYTGGTFALYSDPTPESVFAPNPPNGLVPSTFTDGAPILTGNFTGLSVTTNNFTVFQVGNIEGNIVWTGGSLLDYFNGENCPGLFTGGATWRTTPGVGIPGYLFRHDGKIDLQCPTPAAKSTWGRLKSLYR